MWGKLGMHVDSPLVVQEVSSYALNNPSVVIRIETHNLQEYLAFTLKKKTLLRSKQNFKQITVTKMSGY